MAETIFALSSGTGRSGVAVFRLSGPKVRSTLEALAAPLPEARMARLRKIRDPATGEVIDTGLVLFFPAPASFTGEDVAEIHLHGSLAVIRRFSRILAAIPGLQHAEAGAFTRRAFANGRLDFLDLESLSDLLAAETELQRKLAVDGASRLRLHALRWREALIDLCAQTEAVLDFSEEDDVQQHIDSDAERKIDALIQDIDSVAQQARYGERIRQGFRVALLGPPNAGKSTLLNTLAGRDAAIVSHIPGTTRDILEVHLDLDGMPVILYDTAGFRQSADEIEVQGVERARKLAQAVDLSLWLSPAHDPAPAPDDRFVTVITQVDRIKDSRASDFATKAGMAAPIGISAQTGYGMDALLLLIQQALQEDTGFDSSNVMLAHERQAQALQQASSCLKSAARHGLDHLDLRAEDLRHACFHLDSLTGRIQNDDILGAIFSRFCIGK